MSDHLNSAACLPACPPACRYNIGRQQLHICKGAAAQNTGGVILLKLPSLQKAAERLAALQAVLTGTAFSFVLQHEGQQQGQQPNELHSSSGGSAGAGPSGSSGSGSGSLSSIDVSDPWGQRFSLVADAPGFPSPAGIVELQLPCFTGGPATGLALLCVPACLPARRVPPAVRRAPPCAAQLPCASKHAAQSQRRPAPACV